ncbi:EscN/YscN/HrcN family type III secretion system ATPase, partial [Candidatus Latescibacterota bacterium]
MTDLPFDEYLNELKTLPTITHCGVIIESRGLLIESKGPPASIGDICHIELPSGKKVPAEVVGFRDNRILLMPLGDLGGVAPGLK